MAIYAAHESHAIDVGPMSSVGEAQRVAAEMGSVLGFGQAQQDNLAAVVAEFVTTLAQRGDGGLLLLQSLQENDCACIEVVAIDRRTKLPVGSRGHHGSSLDIGAGGQDLRAVSSLVDVFETYSVPGFGTAMLARLYAVCAKRSPSRMEVGTISIPRPGERVCGDSWAYQDRADRSLAMIVDGLGHGLPASEAALEARRIFLESSSQSPCAIVEASHEALRQTCGAALGVAAIDWVQRVVSFVGVGNITARIWSGGSTHGMASHDGVVGYRLHKTTEFTCAFPPGSLLVMYSDGLVSRCGLDALPCLMNRHPRLMASIIFRDCVRSSDDATILIARESSLADGCQDQR